MFTLTRRDSARAVVKVLSILILCPSLSAFSMVVTTFARRKTLTSHHHDHQHPLYRHQQLAMEQDDNIEEHTTSSRRIFLSATAAFGVTSGNAMLGTINPRNSAMAASTIDADRLEDRFEQSLLKQPALTGVTTSLYGVDNLYYPDFMAGAWDVTQTLVTVETPIGLVYLGGPNGSLEIAEKSMAETKRQLNVPVSLELRYIKTKWGVAEDRVWNTPERLNKFAGRKVVSSASYANVGASNRAAVLAMGGTEDDPLQTVYVRFKGPAAQKSFTTFHRTTEMTNEDAPWYGSEGQRSIFALTNESTAPPIFTDSELLWKLDRNADNENHVRGRLRIVGYLNAQSDKLYFEARNRAVSIQDYTLEMKRIQ